MELIPVSRGLWTKVDDEDFEELDRYKWFAQPGYRTFYAARFDYSTGVRLYIAMHRVILQAPTGSMIDHEDGDGLNNQKINIRFSNKSKNALNCDRCINAKGVYYDRTRNRWNLLRNEYHNKRWYLGTFLTEEQAINARREALVR